MLKQRFIIALATLVLTAVSCGSSEQGSVEINSTEVNTEQSYEPMRTLTYTPTGVCSKEIHVEVKGDKILRVEFTGGCPGNTLGVVKLVQGLTINEAIAKLKGIDCKERGTSCPDQLTKALEKLL